MNISSHCLFASVISDEKSAVILIEALLYSHKSLLLVSRFFLCLGFRKVWFWVWVSLKLLLIVICWASWTSNLGSFQPIFFEIFTFPLFFPSSASGSPFFCVCMLVCLILSYWSLWMSSFFLIPFIFCLSEWIILNDISSSLLNFPSSISHLQASLTIC